jgi:formamidopyrimidine-DNA glycosylase
MLELPEALVLAKQVNETLSGRRIKHVTANQSPHKFAWYSGDPAQYDNFLRGKAIGTAAAYSGEVEIQVEDRVMLIGTPMRYHAADEKRPVKHQLLLEFEDASAVSASIQMWGCLLCVKQGEEMQYEGYHYGKTRPIPISEQFDRAYFDSLFDEGTGKLSTKAFLATQQRIPGLGNGVLQDILWTAGLHPKRKMGGLSGLEVDHMFSAVKKVLHTMTMEGGRDTERDLFGCPGGYKTVLSKNTVGQPCPACGTTIRKEAYMGGSIYYCLGCQNLC